MSDIILIAEKREQANDIAKAMGWNVGREFASGTLEGKPVKMAWARGHLVGLIEPDEAKPDASWSDPATLTPIPRNFKLKAGKDSKGFKGRPIKDYLKTIKTLLSKASEVIIATDPDREGEAIGWELLDFYRYNGPVRRLWLSKGLDPASVKSAMANIRQPQENKSRYRASEARGRADWSYQFAVRAYSYYGRGGAFGPLLGQGKGKESVVSVGRVQTPTLRMIVERDLEIENFTPRDHFLISGLFQLGKGDIEAKYKPEITQAIIDSAPEGVEWRPNKQAHAGSNALDQPLYTGRKQVKDFENRLMAAAQQAVVTDYGVSKKRKGPPLTYDLATAQKDVSKKLRITGKKAQEIIESLYQKGFTSYPRTEHGELPDSAYTPAERNPVFSHLTGIQEIAQQAQYVMDLHNGNIQGIQPFKPSCISSKQMEHHGLMPTQKAADFTQMTSQEKEAYMMIVKRYIQAFYPPAQIAVTQAEVDVPVEDLLGHKKSHFVARAEVIIDPGWMDAFSQKKAGGSALPEAKKGDNALLKKVELESQRTSPPARYNDTSLPTAMKNVGKSITDPKLQKFLKDSSGIGTPATRSSIIETLLNRGFVERKKGEFISTPKGRQLIKIVPDWISSPETTAVWEGYMTNIVSVQDDQRAIKMRDQFVEKQFQNIEKLINQLRTDMDGKVSTSGNKPPSQKQIALAQKLANEQSLQLPDGYDKDWKICSEFIEANIGKGGPRPPSDKQKNFADKLASDNGVQPPPDYDKDWKVCSEFIDKMMKEGNGGAPSEKQVALAERIANEQGVDLPNNYKSNRKVCSEFIDANIGNGKPSEKQLEFAKKLSEEKGISLPSDVFKSQKQCSDFIDRHMGGGKKK